MLAFSRCQSAQQTLGAVSFSTLYFPLLFLFNQGRMPHRGGGGDGGSGGRGRGYGGPGGGGRGYGSGGGGRGYGGGPGGRGGGRRGRGSAPAPDVLTKRCTVEYDGASKGNPGPSGAGFVLHDHAGGPTIRGRVGLGTGTNNAAEYKALNKGLEAARDYGYTDVTVKGDSELVHGQITGEFRTRNDNLKSLQNETRSLASNFKSVQSQHVPRDYNRAADYEANRGTNLREGEYQEDYDYDDSD